MFKKVLLLCSVSFGLLFFVIAEECFADASDLFEQAKAYEASGNYTQAEAIYRSIVADYPGTDEALQALTQLAKLHIKQYDDAAAEAAISTLKTDYAQHPELCTNIYSLAEAFWYCKKYDKARDLSQYVSQNSSDSDMASKGQSGIAYCEIRLGNYSAAEQAIDALKNDYSQHKYLLCKRFYGLADEYWALEKYGNAKALYKYIAQNSAESKLAMLGLSDVACCEIRLGNDSAAEQAIEALWSKYNSTEEFVMNIISIMAEYSEVGQYAASEALYDRLVTEFPNDPSIPVSFGNVNLANKYYAEAIKFYQAALNQAGDNKDGQLDAYAGMARMARVKIHMDVNDHQQVLADVDMLIADYSDNPRLPLSVFVIGEEYYNKAFRYEKEGLEAEARDSFKKALIVWERIITQLPESQSIGLKHAYYSSADCHQRLGEYEKAIEYYRKIVASWPNYKYAWDVLFRVGRNYEDLKESGIISKSEADTKIKAAYEQLLKKYPDCKAAKPARDWLNRHN